MQNIDTYSIVYLNKGNEFLKFSNPYQAFAYFKNYKIDLLSGKKTKSSLDYLRSKLELIKIKENLKNPLLFHLFYEYGYFFTENEKHIKDDELLVIELNYNDVSPYLLQKGESCKVKGPYNNLSFEKYNKSYLKGRDHLLKGNCYQFNLTFQHNFGLEKSSSLDDIFYSLWKEPENRGAYAHVSVIPFLKKVFISNSPECLFQIKSKKEGNLLWSMPIKGSQTLEKDRRRSWQKLKSCKKNQAELFMITDLLRNDLSKIEKPNAKVIKKKSPLLVPKILHQFSLISVMLNKEVSLFKIIRSLFPGGSVTGAPKKRVMEILKELEFSGNRGFYCGSTVILYEKLKAASINIRSATIDLENYKFNYGSGGGITLLSTSKEEFNEMHLKIKGFINLIH